MVIPLEILITIKIHVNNFGEKEIKMRTVQELQTVFYENALSIANSTIEHFQKSSLTTSKIKNYQIDSNNNNMNLGNSNMCMKISKPKGMKSNNDSRWMSTYHSLKRAVELTMVVLTQLKIKILVTRPSHDRL
ncbi:hypothetical protein ACTFIR_009410 [Dictyostelium discoideum]